MRILNSVVATCLAVSSINVFGQCKCQTFAKDNLVGTQCPIKPLTLHAGLGIGQTSTGVKRLSLILNFRTTEMPQEITSSLIATLTNGRIVELQLFSSELINVDGSQLCQSMFVLSSENQLLLKKAPLRSISYTMDRDQNLVTVLKNSSVVISELNCLD